jgi:hypothetical protein
MAADMFHDILKDSYGLKSSGTPMAGKGPALSQTASGTGEL